MSLDSAPGLPQRTAQPPHLCYEKGILNGGPVVGLGWVLPLLEQQGAGILTSLGNNAGSHKTDTQRAWDLQIPSSPAHQPLTFRSMSRTHLSTRWLVQTTGSMFCVSQRARRSWRAL